MASIDMKPMLWRFFSYLGPGLPWPASSSMVRPSSQRGLGFGGLAVGAFRHGRGRGLQRGDDEVALDRSADAGGELDFRHADGVADVVAGQVDDQLFRDLVGRAGQLDV